MARSNTIPDGNSGIVIHEGFSAQNFGGEGGWWKTVIKANTTLPAIAGGANLAVGKKAWSYPAGAIYQRAAYMSLALTQSDGNVNADTPDIGLGTTIASGVVAVLGGTAAFENILTGQTAANCTGTATTALVGTELLIPAANSHDGFVNVADGWAASGDAALGLTGDIVLIWCKVA